MKRTAKALIAAYVLVVILETFVSAAAGSLWPFCLVLALFGSCTMLKDQIWECAKMSCTSTSQLREKKVVIPRQREHQAELVGSEWDEDSLALSCPRLTVWYG